VKWSNEENIMEHTIQNLRETYLAGNKRIKWSTQQLTDRAFNYLLRAIGNMELRYMKIEHAEQFQLWLLNRYARTTVNIYMKIIRPPFRYAIRRNWMKDDVFSIPLLKVTEERERVYEPQEVEQILEVTNQIWRLRIMLAYTCGLRRGEVLNLTKSDLDFARKLIHVQPSKPTRDTWGWEPKGQTCRTLPMPEVVEKMLQSADQYYVCLSDIRYWRLKQLLKNGQLSERLKLCPDENFSTPFKKILRKANVADGTFHDLRRTYGTNMAEAGMPQSSLAYLMGHADSKTTEKFYIKIRRSHVVEQARGVAGHSRIGATRFELMTHRPPADCSTKLSYAPNILTNLSNKL